MGDEEGFIKRGFSAAGAYGQGDAAQRAEGCFALFVEGEGYEAWAGSDDGEAELAGNVVGQPGGAEFGKGESAGGDDEGVGCDYSAGGVDGEFSRFGDFADRGIAADFDVGTGAFFEEHGDDLGRTAITEELAGLFFVPCDSVFFDQGEEVLGGKARECGAAEVGI